MSAPISTEGRAALRAIREGELRGRGVGGDSWLVTRESGEGVASETTTIAMGLITALVGERPAGRIVGAAPNTLIGAVAWEAIILSSALALLPEDVLTSAASGDAVRLRAVVDRRLHETWEVAPL